MYIFLLLTIIYAYVVIIYIITYCGYLLLFMGRARASHRGAVRPRGRGAVRRWPLREGPAHGAAGLVPGSWIITSSSPPRAKFQEGPVLDCF